MIKVIVNHPHTEAGPEGFDKKPSEYGLDNLESGPGVPALLEGLKGRFQFRTMERYLKNFCF